MGRDGGKSVLASHRKLGVAPMLLEPKFFRRTANDADALGEDTNEEFLSTFPYLGSAYH